MANLIVGPTLAGRQKLPLGGVAGQVVQADEYGNPSWVDLNIVNNYGPVKTIALRAGGAHYAVGDVLTLVADGASGATADVDTVDDKIESIELADGGSGYAVNDVLTVVQAGGSAGTAKVTEVDTSIDTIALNAGGTHYKAGDVLTVADGTGGTAIVDSVTETIESGSVADGGAGYAVDDVLTVVQEGGSAGTFTVATVDDSIATVEVVSGGTGYAVEDVLTIVQAGGSLGTATVTEVDAGVVTAVTLLAAGSGYAKESGLATTVEPSGGSGCTLAITIVGEVLTVTPLAAGDGYATADNLATTVEPAGGTGCLLDIVIEGAVEAITAGAAGSGYEDATGAATTVAPAGGTGATVDITTSKAVTEIELTAAGSGYATADGLSTTVAPSGGTGAEVNIVIDGTVTGITLDAPGTRYQIAAGLATTVAPAGGSGATVDVTDLNVPSFASAAEIIAGTEAAKIVAPGPLEDSGRLPTADAVTALGADGANVPTADEKTRLGDIQAASGASTVEKLSYLLSGSTAGYTHLTKLAAAEEKTALWDYGTAAKMPPALLREIVEESSNGAATVKTDDLGFPSMMFILSGPKLLGYLHNDYGTTTALKTAVLASPGSGYVAGEVLGIAGGTGGTIRILTVDGSGAVLTFRFANRGTGYSATTGAATTGGSGTGCTVTTTIGPVHPAFVVNGVEKTEILYSMFDATTFNGSAYNGSGAGWRAICWPGLFPTASLNFDASKLTCTAKGSGWHLGSIWENDLIKVLAMKGATEPRGNTQYGQTHESGYQFNETAVRSDGAAPGIASGTAKHRNGACSKFWAHNHDRWGIFDMVGDVWRWTDQLKLNNGEVFLTDDNYYGLAEASWPTTGAFFDGNGKLWGSVHAGAYVTSVVHTSQIMDASYDALDLEIRAKLLKAGVTTKLTQASANPFAPKGSLWTSADAERLPYCGGLWNNGSLAGLAALNLSDLRSGASISIGFRPCYIAP